MSACMVGQIRNCVLKIRSPNPSPRTVGCGRCLPAIGKRQHMPEMPDQRHALQFLTYADGQLTGFENGIFNQLDEFRPCLRGIHETGSVRWPEEDHPDGGRLAIRVSAGSLRFVPDTFLHDPRRTLRTPRRIRRRPPAPLPRWRRFSPAAAWYWKIPG